LTALLSLKMLTMKKWLERALLLMAFSILFSCNGNEKKGGEEQGQPEKTITSLAQLLENSTSTSAAFDFTISNLVVTAVYENYAQLEDGTSGAQLNKAGHGLTVGQIIDGRITGKARNTSGALFLSELNTSGAKVTTASSLPETRVSLAEILADKAKYTNRRVKLENVTFVNGFNGTAGGSGSFSQKGVQIPATCRPADVVIPDGWQGDLVCFPSSAACYIFSANDFSEHEINTPLAAINNLGVYSSASSNPRAILSYRQGTDQYAYGTGSEEREFRLQNYNEEWVLQLTFPVKYKLGQEMNLGIEAIGLSNFTSGTSKVFVEKISGDRIWLMDYDADLGYVCKIVEE